MSIEDPHHPENDEPGQRRSLKPEHIEDERTSVSRATSLWSRVGLTLGLVGLWALLWGELSPLTLVTGTVLAILVSVVFFLPAIDFSGRVNFWRVLVFLVRLLIDIVSASVQVSWLVLSPKYTPSNAILAVGLHTRSDLIMTWTAESLSIVPGSIVVDIDREESVLYIHSLDVRTDADIERVRAAVLSTERRLTLAVGSRSDLERLRAGREARFDPRPDEGRNSE